MKKRIVVSNPSFEEIRSNNCIYADKTEYIYNLVNDVVNYYYFISRPRRYGKSLMCSTLKCLFEGKRELFKGLYIDSTDYSFEKYPVYHFNFAEYNTTSYEAFLNDFQIAIINNAALNGIEVEKSEPSTMLLSIMDKSEKEIVIIVDEYDTPIIHTYKNLEKADRIRETLSAFYSVIKNRSENIRFFFLTGITKFSNMSIFSQMNNLTDLTFDKKFASAFGYTEEELETNFSEYIDAYMEREDRAYETREEFLNAIRDYYDGYSFSYESLVKVYNPVSVGYFFKEECSFKPYWENTGTSTLAVELAKDYHLGAIVVDDITVDIEAFTTFDYSLLASKNLNKYQIAALLYYTGYLTINNGNVYSLTLTFPNKEVRTSFTRSLIQLYVGLGLSNYLGEAGSAVRAGDIPRLVKVLNAFYVNIPYAVLNKEIGYEGMFYAFFVLMGGCEIKSEEYTLLGRIDVVIEIEKHVYVIEIKVDQSADVAIEQIKAKRYYEKFVNTDKTINIVGINFSSESRKITDWKEEKIDKTKDRAYLG